MLPYTGEGNPYGLLRQTGRRSQRAVWRRWWAWLCNREKQQQKLMWRPPSSWLTRCCCLQITGPVASQTREKSLLPFYCFVETCKCPASIYEKVSLTKLVVLVWITSLMLTMWAWGFTKDPYLVHSTCKWRDNGMLQLCASCKPQTHCWIVASHYEAYYTLWVFNYWNIYSVDSCWFKDLKK